MTISKKLLVTLCVALLSVLLVGMYGVWQLGQAQDRFQYVMSNTFPSLDSMSAARRSLTDMRIAVRDLLLAQTPEQKDSAKKTVQENEAKFDATLDDYLATKISNDEDRQLLETDKAAIIKYKNALEKVIALVEAGNITAATLAMHQASQQTTLINQALDAHYKFNTDLADHLAQENQSSYQLARLLSFAIIAAAFLITGLLSAQLYRNIRSGLEQIHNSLTIISDSLDFRNRVEIKREDEIGKTNQALNRLMDTLQSSFRTLREAAEEVGSASQNLTETASQVSSAASAQSESASNMAASIEEMTVSINHVSEQAQVTHAGAKQAEELVSSGSDIIQKTINDIHEISSVVTQSASSIQQLETDSSQVGEVVGVIRDIAEQTNLLALNAAIEAARAGEQGRGFAVVADEVRKLAERTAKSTREIAATIETMMSRAKETVTQMNTAEQLVQTGVGRADEADKAIKLIGGNAAKAAASISEISAAIQQQGSASNNIAIQVEHTAQMSEESSAAAKQTAESAVRLDMLVKKQLDTINRFHI
jgi:methyl-accepting chemotaxis protein